MKLKKIASLALAGIMAVSMLTACGEGGKKEEEGSSSSEITTVNGAAEALNAALSRNKDVIKFENDDTLNKNLEAYFALHPIMGDEWNSKKYDDDDINDNDLKNAIGADYIGKVNLNGVITTERPDGDHDGKTAAWVSMYNAAVYSEADALKTVGKAIDLYDFVEDKGAGYGNDGKMYDFSGAASVLEVKSAKGGASAWVVVVTITKDYAKV